MNCNNNITFGTFGNSVIYAGVIGENEVRTVTVDCTAVLAEFETYTVTILIQLPGSSEVNPAPCIVNNGIVSHTFTDTELQTAGMGVMTIMITSLDGRVKKSANATLMIGDVLTQAREVPTEVENWIASVTDKLIPDSGVAKNQLSEGVQDSLDKADTALQEADLTPYRTAADQDTLDQEYRESIAPSLAKADTALQASALTPYRTAAAQDALDTAYRESIAPSLAKADTALQAAALEPYRTAADQDTIDAAAFAAIEPKLIPSTGVAKNQLAAGVQASLDKADTALQSSALTPYRTAADQDTIDAAFFSTTDTTLTEAGQPADAKTTGDALRSLPVAYQNTSPAVYTVHETEETNSRNMANIWQVRNSSQRLAKSFIIKFVPQQNGTPSAESPVAITGSTNPNVRIGKGNLYNGSRKTGHNLRDDGTEYELDNYQVTDYIDVSGISDIRIVYYNSQSSARTNKIAFYDADKTFISINKPSNVLATSWKTITGVTVPANAVFMRVATPTFSPNYMLIMGDNTSFSPTLPEGISPLFGGTIDIVSGEIVVTWAEIASYDGELLPGAWLSSKDVYAEGTTPTAGAQVVYQLATPLRYSTTPAAVQMFEGGTCAQSVISNPKNRGLKAEYARSDILTKSDIDTTLSVSGYAADAAATGAVISPSGWGSMAAAENIDSGAYFIAGNKLYIATAAISHGETIAPGTNCTLTNIVEALNALNAANA